MNQNSLFLALCYMNGVLLYIQTQAFNYFEFGTFVLVSKSMNIICYNLRYSLHDQLTLHNKNHNIYIMVF